MKKIKTEIAKKLSEAESNILAAARNITIVSKEADDDITTDNVELLKCLDIIEKLIEKYKQKGIIK
jgi:hypothetical protein